MHIKLANPRGFCAGVDRAIEIVNRALEVFGPPIYVRHEVVHNKFVVEDLRSRGRSFISLRNSLVPFLRLREMFDTGTPPELHQKVVVVSTGAERIGLVVDQIIGDHQTVIKSMSKLHSGLPTFSGATILGDGGVALILDVGHLVAKGQQQEAQMREAV